MLCNNLPYPANKDMVNVVINTEVDSSSIIAIAPNVKIIRWYHGKEKALQSTSVLRIRCSNEYLRVLGKDFSGTKMVGISVT